MSKYKIFILFLFCATLLLATDGLAQKRSQKKATQKANTEQATQNGEEENSLTAWDILEMTSWLFWPFVFVTASGVTFICYRGLIEYREKARSQAILNQKIEVRDLRRLIRTVQTAQPNRASRLLQQMVSTFNKTNRAEPISADVTQFVTSEREAYETFNRVLGFLSDTAGALGLLGTVWGIFETFHGGKLDGPTILMGMSISLVTTLVGLLISLALNFGGTSIFAIFNRYMNVLVNRAEELRQALLYLESRPGKAGDKAESPVAATAAAPGAPAMEQHRQRPVPENAEAYQNGNGKRARLEQMARQDRKRHRPEIKQQSPAPEPAVTEVTQEQLMANQQQQNVPDVFARQNQKYDDDENIW